MLSEFLVVAAVLVELKSRRLLPGTGEVEPDEELVGWEERDLLLARLLECQAYAAAADGFALLIEQAARSVPRTAGLDPDLVVHAPDLLEGVTPDQVAAAFMRATAERPAPVVDLYHVTVDAVTVADAVAELALRLPAPGPSTFRQLTGHLTTRIEIIVRFLALLELCKQGRVSLDQGHTFGDLAVAWVAGSPGRRCRSGAAPPTSTRADHAPLPRGPGRRGRPDRGRRAGPARPAGRAARAPRRADRPDRRRADRVLPATATGDSRWPASPAGCASRPIPDLAPYVERFANVGVSSRLSAAALETLAIVAYKQPVSRAQVAALRGVNVDGVVRLLEHRGYITAGGPGRRARARPSSTPPPTPSWSASGSTGSTSCPRSRTCCPVPRPWPSSRSRCARPPMADGRRDGHDGTAADRAAPPASGCRRCWPGPGWVPGGCARTSSPTAG